MSEIPGHGAAASAESASSRSREIRETRNSASDESPRAEIAQLAAGLACSSGESLGATRSRCSIAEITIPDSNPRILGRDSIAKLQESQVRRAAELNRAELSDRLISDEERRERRADRNDGRSAADSPPGIRFCKVRNLGQAVADPRIARSEGLSARAALSVGQPRGLHVHFRKHRVWRGALSSSHRVYFA